MHSHALDLIIQHKYLIITILAIIEGPIISVIAGFLFKFGILSLIPAYLLLMLGDLIGDVLWYGVGYYFGERFIRRFGKFFSIEERNVEKVKLLFHKHKNRVLIFSKVTMGFGFALLTLITAGMVRIPFRRYLALNTLGQFIWTALLLLIGYSLGHLYTNVEGIFSTIGIVAGSIFVLVLLFGYGRYLQKRFGKIQ